jgi:hypothetical protein
VWPSSGKLGGLRCACKGALERSAHCGSIELAPTRRDVLVGTEQVDGARSGVTAPCQDSALIDQLR